jgi:hypothetical protein
MIIIFLLDTTRKTIIRYTLLVVHLKSLLDHISAVIQDLNYC